MNKKEQIMSILKKMGYSPKYDKEGDIRMLFQMKTIFFLVNEDEDENYLSIVLPRFVEVKEGEESLALAICNKMTRELKLIKAYVDEDFQAISASGEIFYSNDEALEYAIKGTLRMIGLARSQYHKTRKTLTE